MLVYLKQIYQYRELLWNLTAREIKARYKQSVLGYFWVILNPFFQMLVMALIFSVVMKVPSWGIPYPVFLYVGLLPWNLLAKSLESATNSLVNNASLIKQIALPRELFVISTILAKIVDFFLASSILVLFMVFYQIPINLTIFWLIPVFLTQLIFTFGLGLLLAAANLFYRDIQYLLGLIITLWMYLTPVIYPVEIVPESYRFIFKLNPMAVFVNAYRQIVFNQTPPNFNSLGIAILVCVIILLVSYKIFKKLEGLFADVV
ncbi:ABC transporter permease [Patescibacteria group bacterium]|nr:ABC transporter permease [Patescibacteria group bacterium]MBU1931200.1 ABC transporter permease [Patescibacteria group bacterium]